MPGRICASVPISSAGEAGELPKAALASGADYVELRFDYTRVDSLGAAISASADYRSSAIFTLRSKAQGGSFAGSESDRIAWLREIVSAKPMLADIELDTLKANDDLADFVESQRTPILVSWHDFSGTPPADELADILAEMRVYSNFVKIVTTARAISDSLRLLGLYRKLDGLNAVIFAMGEAGVLSRVLCTHAGAPFTYASIGRPTAPGQLSVQEMRSLFELIDSNDG